MGLLFLSSPRFAGRAGVPGRGRWSRLVVACLMPLLVAGCGEDDTAPPPTDDGGSNQEATSLTFVPGGVLKLLPLEPADLNLAAAPPDRYLVRFALLADPPDAGPNDASLNRAEVFTDTRGVATVTLTAPSTPSAFTVRATIGALEARLPVSVSDRGYATIIAEPSYGGVRPIETWVASVRIGSSCADLAGFPSQDGALVATSPGKETPTIDSVPVGPIASVSVRSGQFAYGCTNVPDLTADEVRMVPVEVLDRPLQLSGELDLSLRIDEQAEEWSTLLEDAISDSLSAFRNGAADDVWMLLEDMQALDENVREAFGENAEAYYAEIRPNPGEPTLTDQARAWLEAGIEDLEPLQGELELRNSSAMFRLISAAGVPADESGFLGTSTWSAFADPGDTLILGGPLRFQATRWVVALANGPALEQFPAASDAAEALVWVADCRCIASKLTTVASGGVLYPGCDTTCVQHLCEAAIVTAWARAADADGDLTRVSIGLTGTAQVDEEARPISLSGSWLGTLAGPSSAVGGTALGVADQP